MGYLLTKLCVFNTFVENIYRAVILGDQMRENGHLIIIGLYYPSPNCDYIFKDFVELEYMEMEGD
jgi:hypothetical protein